MLGLIMTRRVEPAMPSRSAKCHEANARGGGDVKTDLFGGVTTRVIRYAASQLRT